MKYTLLILLLLLGIDPIYGQEKLMKGDTSYFKYTSKKVDKLGLEDLTQSKREKVTRIYLRDQVVELAKNKDSLVSFLINYVPWKKYRDRNKGKVQTTFIQKRQNLDYNQALLIEQLLNKYQIQSLSTDNAIKQWTYYSHGTDYQFEFSTPLEYKFYSYSNPHGQDSIEIADIIVDFTEELKRELMLDTIYKVFSNALPKKGCYYGGHFVNCYSTRSTPLSILSSGKLPFGLSFPLSLDSLGKRKFNLRLHTSYQSNLKENFDLFLQATKVLVFSNSQLGNDFTRVSYRVRKLDFLSSMRYENTRLLYGYYFKQNNFSVSSGIEMLQHQEKYWGFSSLITKSFPNQKLFTNLSFVLYQNAIDYNLNVGKSFYLGRIHNWRIGRTMGIRLGFEKFRSYYDYRLGLYVYL